MDLDKGEQYQYLFDSSYWLVHGCHRSISVGEKYFLGVKAGNYNVFIMHHRTGGGGLHPRGVEQTPPGYYGIRSTSGRYTSYWNAFLFMTIFFAFNLNFVKIIRKEIWNSKLSFRNDNER